MNLSNSNININDKITFTSLYKNNKTLLLQIIIFILLLSNIFITSPSKFNIYILILFVIVSIIYNYSTDEYEFIKNNKYLLYITTISLLHFIIYKYDKILKNKFYLIINIILIIAIILRYISFMSDINLNNLISENNYYHNVFFFNIFGFYFWYHLFVFLILLSLFLMDTSKSGKNSDIKWTLNEKIIISVFVVFITIMIDYMYFVAKPYNSFN
jgi:hypothetical protein